VIVYAAEIFQLLLKDELKYLPRHNYMDRHNGQGDKAINAKMRAILVDWLVDVGKKYALRDETLYLSVMTIDRYLAIMPVLRKRLQLVGVAAMFMAAKLEEIRPVGVGELVVTTDHAYTKEEILGMECQMLTTLNFQIVIPTVAQFMDPLQRMNGCDAAHRELFGYLCELALLEIRMIKYTPSHLASAAMLLSNELIGRMTPWPPLLQASTQHTEEDLRACVQELQEILDRAPAHSLQAVRKKYRSPQHHSVANRWP
jgi:cyclin B